MVAEGIQRWASIRKCTIIAQFRARKKGQRSSITEPVVLWVCIGDLGNNSGRILIFKGIPYIFWMLCNDNQSGIGQGIPNFKPRFSSKQ